MKPVTVFVAALAALVRGQEYDNKEKCFGELGCFPITSDFQHPIYRPVNVAVDPRETIKTTFLFHTRQNADDPKRVIGYEIGENSLENVPFNPEHETKFIVHGFLDTQFFGEWMSQLKNDLLKIGDFNVIIVDWSGGNSLPYTQATANTRVVGAEMGLLINKLMKHFNITEDNFHLYGHSLGAHIVGYAGAILHGKLPRITGMDAAEPYFQHMPISVRLDPSDAKFVETIHTDAKSFYTHLGLGFSEPVGHLDFYPNGGENMPGCSFSDRIKDITQKGIKGLSSAAACDHMRSTVYVRDFLTKKNGCTSIAFRCPTYELFLEGKCYDCGQDGSKCAPVTYGSMSYFRPFAKADVPAKMYFNTNKGDQNLCLFHYNVQIKMRRYQKANPKKLASSVDGSYFLTLNGSLESETFSLNTQGSTLHAGSTSSLLITTPTNIGQIGSVNFRYVASSLFLPPRMEIEYIKVTPMNAAVSRDSL